MRHLSFFVIPLLLGACSDSAVQDPTDAGADAVGDASDPDAQQTKPTVDGHPGVQLLPVPPALADQSTLFQLGDGTIVLVLFPSVRPTTGPFPWSSADAAAADTFVTAAKTVAPGARVVLPASRWPRASLARSYAMDAPPGSCSLGADPKCVEDPTTRTVHVPPGEIPNFDGQARTFMGPNVSGLLLDVTKSVVDVNGQGATTIFLYGKSSSLVSTFDAVDVPSTANPSADSEGFVKASEPFDYDFSNRVLFSEGPVVLRMKSGHFTATPSFKSHLQLDGLKVKSAELLLRGDLDVKAEVELTVSTPPGTGYKRDFSVVLYEQESPLPPMMIGAIPIPQAIKGVVTAQCSLDLSAVTTVSTGVSMKEQVVVGGRYSDAGFTNASAIAKPTLAAIGPTFTAKGAGTATCAASTHFSLLYFGVIGPYVEFAVAASIAATYASPGPLKWGLGGAVVAGAGFETVKVPGLGPISNFISTSVPTKETVFYTQSYELGSGTL